MPPHDLTLHRVIPRAVPTMIGRRIGRYRVLAPLGRGGMSSVWRAHDELLGRDVALKLLDDELASSPRARRRFRHEARVAASLDHPGVAAVYDSGEADGATFIAMALIDGETVAERLERSLMPIDEALRVAGAVVGALAHAHAHGVIHRDVTSRNIMLARDGRVLVLDFGLALAAGVSRVSSSRTMVGTAAYMAPEVLQGRDADARSDLYGLGVVLHEMLTGRVPFEGERREAITYAALNQEPTPPSRWRAEVMPGLDRVVLRLLAREPTARYASAEALMADLAAVGDEAKAAALVGTPAASSGSAPGTRSVAAELVESGHRPLYLVLVPFEVEAGAGADASAARLASNLSRALSTSVTHLGRVHLVTAEPPAPEETVASYTRRVGAHALLAGTVQVESATARVAWRLLDADRGAQIAGGSVRGAAADVVSLEDELVADVRRGLGLKVETGGFDSRAVTQVPAAAERYQQARQYLTRSDNEASVDGAITILERLVAAAPTDASCHGTLARAFLAKYALARQHHWKDRAAAEVERAMELAPDAPETLLALGELHSRAGRPEEARVSLERALFSDPSSFEGRLDLALVLGDLRRGQEAVTRCREAIESRPDDWRGHHIMGMIRLARGEYALAIEAWQRALTLCPDNARVSDNLGTALFRSDRIADAVDAYRQSVAIRPTALALTNLGTALFFEARYPEAAAAFQTATELTPADPIVWGNLGNAQRLSPGLGGHARESLERAVGLMEERLSRTAQDADGWARIAGWYAALERRDEARLACGRALDIDGESASVLASVGHTYVLIGEIDVALRHLGAALDRGYGVGLLERSPDLRSLGEDPRFLEILARAAGRRPSGPEGVNPTGG
jgi:eukaryotic-like serine/threonine-protein kinase